MKFANGVMTGVGVGVNSCDELADELLDDDTAFDDADEDALDIIDELMAPDMLEEPVFALETPEASDPCETPEMFETAETLDSSAEPDIWLVDEVLLPLEDDFEFPSVILHETVMLITISQIMSLLLFFIFATFLLFLFKTSKKSNSPCLYYIIFEACKNASFSSLAFLSPRFLSLFYVASPGQSSFCGSVIPRWTAIAAKTGNDPTSKPSYPHGRPSQV
jgi:hypothetical protein